MSIVLPLRPLGRTSVRLTSLGFGTTMLGNLYRTVSETEAFAATDAAYAAGIRYFDTAPHYGVGLAERRLGGALRRFPGEPPLISTKVGWLTKPALGRTLDASLFASPPPFVEMSDYSRDGVMRSVEDSMQRLGTDRIDILLIHDVDRRNHGDAYPEVFRKAMAGAYPALLELREQGVVKAVGCGLNEWQACQDFLEAGDFDCFLLAGRYTLLDQQSLESFLPLCERRGAGIILGGPFNSGILASGPVEGAYYDYAPATPVILERARRIEAVCRRHATPLKAAALQLPLHHPVVATVIPGMANGAEAAENLRLLSHPIPPDLWAELKGEGLIRAEAPTP